MRTRLPITLTLLLLQTACGGSSGGNDDPNVDGARPDVPDRRIATISIDLERDGTADRVIAYGYDSAGRVTSRDTTNLNDPDESERVEYDYEDGFLVRKHSEEGEDVHVYENGFLVMSTRYSDGEHTYRYDADGRLVGSTGDDFFYDDDDDVDPSPGATPDPPEFRLNYAGDRVDSIATVDGEYAIAFLHDDRGRVVRMERRYADALEPAVSAFDYDDEGNVSRVRRFDGSEVSDVRFTRDGSGRLSEVLTREEEFGDEPEITAQALEYDTEGFLVSREVTASGQSSAFFFTPDQTLTYTYEDGSCVRSYSSDPAKLAILDVLLATRVSDPSIDCGYPLDVGEL